MSTKGTCAPFESTKDEKSLSGPRVGNIVLAFFTRTCTWGAVYQYRLHDGRLMYDPIRNGTRIAVRTVSDLQSQAQISTN